MRATLNAVCTSTRFGAVVPKACPFCAAPAQDKLTHFASCPIVADMIAAVSVGCLSLWQENHDARLFLTSSVCDLRAFVYHACILDLVLCSYNALLHGTLNARADDLGKHAIGQSVVSEAGPPIHHACETMFASCFIYSLCQFSLVSMHGVDVLV